MTDLNILIPTTPSRSKKLSRLLDNLSPQLRSNTKVSILNTDSSMTIGEKRNRLLSGSKGIYSVFCDDDDSVSGNYVDAILEALEDQPDVVEMNLAFLKDGTHSGMIHQSLKYPTMQRENYRRSDGSDYFTMKKSPNHINPIRTDLMKKVGFPHLRWGEDRVFSQIISRYLTKEATVDQVLYYYLFDSENNSLGNFRSNHLSK